MEGMQRVAAGPGARERGQEMRARRVVDHLAEIGADHGVVDEPPMAFDVREQREMVGEVRTVPVGRNSGRARHISQAKVSAPIAATAAAAGRSRAASRRSFSQIAAAATIEAPGSGPARSRSRGGRRGTLR